MNINTEYEEKEEEKESELIRAFYEAEKAGEFCMDRYISIKKREEKEWVPAKLWRAHPAR